MTESSALTVAEKDGEPQARFSERSDEGGRVRRGLLWSALSNILMRLGNLAVGIVVARLVAPEAFGLFAVALTVWSILGSIAEFGLGAELVRRDDYERRIPTVATLGLGLSVVLGVLMLAGSSTIAELFGSPASTDVIRLMSVPLFLIGLSVVPAAVLQREVRQGTLLVIDGSALVLSTGVTIGLAVLGAGPLALAVGRIVGQAATVVMQCAATRRVPRFGWSGDVAAEVLRFGLPLAAANVLAWSTITVGNVAVARAAGPVALGLYVLAFNIASWPMSVAGQSVRVVALPAFSRIRELDRRGQVMVCASGPLWSISLLMAIGLAFLASDVVALLYGERWAGSAQVIAPLVLFGALRVIFDLGATYLISAGRSGSVMVVQVFWLGALVPALVLALPRLGMPGAGWAQLVVAVVVVLPAYVIAMRAAGVRSSAFFRAWLRPTVAVLPLTGTLALIATTVQRPFVAVVLGGAAGLVLYVLPMARWWRRQLRRLADL